MENCILTKKCTKCGSVKPLECFPYFSTKETGRKNSCKECNNKLAKVRNKLRKDNPKPDDNICLICKRDDKKLVLDHDHETDKFRGWLCNDCNSALGKFDDSIVMLINAINYLLERK